MATVIVKRKVTAEELRERLRYEPDTGEFYWRNSIQGTLAGARAGRDGSERRRTICINYVQYKAHRLAWLYVHGVYPAAQIDHINGNPWDNRIANLREATAAENQWNQKTAHSHNATKILGVQWRQDKQKFRARIVSNKKEYFLGHFDSAEEAGEAYLKAKNQLHPIVIARQG